MEEVIDTSPVFSRDFCFVVSLGGKEYYFSATSEEERRLWMQAIQSATRGWG